MKTLNTTINNQYWTKIPVEEAGHYWVENACKGYDAHVAVGDKAPTSFHTTTHILTNNATSPNKRIKLYVEDGEFICGKTESPHVVELVISKA